MYTFFHRECPCLLCDLTRKAQKAMRQQQRFWRQQKTRLKQLVNNHDLKVDEGVLNSQGDLTGQVCDICRNHNHLTRKKNHECPYMSCICESCARTHRRRLVMKRQQRVRRSRITTKVTITPKSKVTDDLDEQLDFKKLINSAVSIGLVI